MNTIVILLDSLNFHCIEPYGATHVRTPNLQRFSERAHVFDNHFVGSAPCMPARRELFSGRHECLWRGWGHMEPWDRHLAREAAQASCVTQMITDHYHYWENAAHGFFEPFHGVDFIRGHENDMWRTDPLDELPAWAAGIDRHRHGRMRNYAGWGANYYANARDWRDADDFPCAQVMRSAVDWLARNRDHTKQFLWVECFDPHEPFFLPEPYRSMYVQGTPEPDFTCWPPYQNGKEAREFVAQASPQELAWIRAQYYGKVTMVDHWLGALLQQLDALDAWQDTAVIVTTDHGHDLCYDGLDGPTLWGKAYPHPESHARIPLMIWHPDHPGQGKRIDALTTAVDMNATVRECTGVEEVDGPHGRSLLPLVRGETDAHRDWVLTGTFGAGVTLTTRDWRLAQGIRGGLAMASYNSVAFPANAQMTGGHYIPGVSIPQWRVPMTSHDHGDFLWQRHPFTLTPDNVITRYPEQAVAMRTLLREAVESIPGPPEMLELLGLHE